MKTRVEIIVLWIIFISIQFISIQPAATAFGSGMQQSARSGTFSADFDDIPISQALSELSRVSRIKILTSAPIDGRIKKSFRNEPIDEIIRELLKGFNYASLWSVKDDGVESITLWVFEKSSARASDRVLPTDEPTLPPSTVPPPPAERPQIPGNSNRQRPPEASPSGNSDGTSETGPKPPEGEGPPPGREASEAEQQEGKEPQTTRAAGAVEVQGIVDASQAQQMDLRKGDIILEYGGVKINRAADLVMESKRKTPEEEVEILVQREGEQVRVSGRGGFIGVRIKTVDPPTEAGENQGR